MKRFDIVCGDEPVRAACTAGEVIRMNVQGKDRNVNLRIEDISRAMVSNVPDVLLDLLEVGSYVHCADQGLTRGSDKLTDWGSGWRRELHFKIPVRLPGLWESAAVKDALTETLGFLSDDSYSFSFVKATKPLAEKELYFSGLTEASFAPDAVALFSGGIDSFAGAVEDIVGHGRKLALVGHHSASKIFNVQKGLIDGLKQKDLALRMLYVPVKVTNAGVEAREDSQRTRSFLFACLALVVARMFGKDRFIVYENGVVSINLPIARDVQGARATRTTHPRVLRGFEAIFSALLDTPIEIETPFQWHTKKEVVGRIAEHGFAHLLAQTVSCTRPRSWTTEQRHCGTCSQCIDRRFAILAAGLEGSEPGERYMLDLLTGDRSADRELRMAVAYVKFFQTLAGSAKNRFLADYPQIASTLSWFPGLTANEARDRIYDLLQRHAADVLGVIAEGTKRHMDALVRGELPAGALLSMCFNRSRIEVAPPSNYDRQVKDFMDRLGPQPFEFAVDDEAGRVLFKGDFYLDGAGYKLVAALLEKFRAGKTAATEIAFIPAPDLADALGITEASLRQQVMRVRKQVADRLAVDLGIVPAAADFIENKERSGYRLNPDLREVAKADLQGHPESRVPGSANTLHGPNR